MYNSLWVHTTYNEDVSVDTEDAWCVCVISPDNVIDVFSITDKRVKIASLVLL